MIDVEKLANDLMGTCKATYYFLEDGQELTLEEAYRLDDLVLECVKCNWWCEPSEMKTVDSEYVCSDCAEDLEEDG